jgi:hypothetical protein
MKNQLGTDFVKAFLAHQELQKSGMAVPFTGSGGVGNEFVQALLANERFQSFLQKNGVLAKTGDTISQSTNIMWYDLKPIVQMLYPYRELIPRISRLPRVSADGGNAFHWKRIVGINTGNLSLGVSEGNRGARIAITEQDMVSKYATMGAESSVTFEGRLAGRNLSPEVLGIAVQSSLRSLMIGEEQALINNNASMPLGTTPTPTLIQTAAGGGITGAFSGAIYVACVALAPIGFNRYKPYNSTTTAGGVLGQITRFNADGSSDTFGGGSAAPSAIATITPTSTNYVTATVTAVTGAATYAWYVGSTNSAASMYLAGLTPSNQAILTKVPASTSQPLSNVYVSGSPQDNSTDVLLPDGVLSQIFGAVTGPSPGQSMATNPVLPSARVTLSQGGSVLYTMASGNTGLTLSGSTITEFDLVFQAAYDQYKLGFDRILISAADMIDTFGAMLNQASAANLYRIWFDADESTGRIIAGRKVTSYMNKFMNNTLDVEVHPQLPPGTIIFWSDRVPYELSGLANILEAKVRQDYYQIQWPWRSRRIEYGVYVDESFPVYFAPAFAAITNKNPSSGTFVF